ncbi:DUF2334 domain-containing protein [Mycolicibacillus trivialis]
MTGELIVSVSRIGAHTRDDVARFCAELDARNIPTSLLVAPRLKHGYRLENDPRTVAWLTERRAGGDAVVLHGYDEAATRGRRAEFALLPAHEANLRLLGADRVLEHVGLRTRLFAAPGWVVSPGALQALPRNGFRLVAGLHGVTDLVTGVTAPARVLGIGEGFLTEPWWCRMLVRAADRTASRGGTVRLTVAATQLDKPAPFQAMLDAVDAALSHGAVPAAYRWRRADAVAEVA